MSVILGINTTRHISKLSQITYNNFEISLVVFMPNSTTNHAITYTNSFRAGKPPVLAYRRFHIISIILEYFFPRKWRPHRPLFGPIQSTIMTKILIKKEWI